MHRYGDPIEVRRVDDVPVRPLWRGPLRKVRAVLAHRIATGAGWAPVGCQD